MDHTPSSADAGHAGSVRPPVRSPRRRAALKGIVVMLALALGVGLSVFRIYGLDTHHKHRGAIWWPPRCRDLTPAAATDVTLRRDLLEHDAIYTLSERDLNEFLDGRFSRPGEVRDSLSERTPARTGSIGGVVGPLGWVITEDTVMYSYTADNGGAHDFYHDAKTGRTYQHSAYW